MFGDKFFLPQEFRLDTNVI